MKQKTIFLFLTVTLSSLAGCGESDDGSSSSSSSSGGGNNPDPTTVFPSSGIPDQNSLTALVETLNPRARDLGNTTVSITALLADQLGNNSTIPDGTQVYFATHGGAIQTSGEFCTTIEGECAVEWRSQSPIPEAGPPIDDPLGSGEQVASYSSGRANVLLWTEGIESFIDNNSNGLFDDGDTQIDDVGDPFLDRNENGVRDNNEEFVDFPIPQLGSGGTYDGPDGLYSGPNCAHSSLCATGINAQSLFLSRNITIAMSSDSVCIVHVGPQTAGPPDYYPSTTHDPETLTTGAAFTFRFLVHDCFGNPPIAGTTVEFNSDVGILRGPESYTVPSTNVDMGTTDTGDTRQRYPAGSLVYSITIEGDPENDPGETGRLEIDVTPPEGIPGYDFVSVTDPQF